ncbi:class I SAM-dependent methyltransferase [Candidatus Woesearchaeota archaeon]|nr:MAG: class I SAM-dependent methyltransferase [Candidatus Woesearchaeota archaeon]
MTGEEKLWDKVYEKFTDKNSVWREGPTDYIMNKVEFLKSEGKNVVLDAGCGDGRNLIALAERGMRAIGVDFSAEALKKCTETAKTKKVDVKLLKNNLKDIEIPDASVDLIVCEGVIEHLRKPEDVIKEFKRVMKDGALAIVEVKTIRDPQKGLGTKISDREFVRNDVYLRFYSLNDFKRLLSGFEVLCIDTVRFSDPYHGEGYHRKGRHWHESYFALVRKGQAI